ncbi:hypothetical protein QR680_010811 [Steinernema hermaphroditum]|uniref:Exocyst complex component 3 n=1 Tax=Steinernema hermaphroditum TaxID=289476 RepID=A0AA39MC60_9BILA|nr:hypothetical protein QR680_010811 [Steinernema hermaphroditum]
MDPEQVEREAQAAALAQVAAMFQRPDQLEKLDALKKKAERKKAAVEAMLRTGVHSQLEGIRTAISHLRSAREDIAVVETEMEEIFEKLRPIPEMKAKMRKLSEAYTVHRQYAAAMVNLKHIFNIHETIEKTHEYIMEGKLLFAHKHIMELEQARDDLMLEVHKLPSERKEFDKNLLKNYFVDVEKLVADLGKQIWYILSRSLEAVRGQDAGQTQLVTALRIIEREERIDKYYVEHRASTGDFMPPGRPREWKKECFNVLERNVQHRVEGNQLEDRTINKSWLARYLEVCRRVIVEDLKVAKLAVVNCFPPHYQIYERFVQMYHNCVSRKLREIAQDKLEKNELVQLLNWVQNYGSDQMLGNPRLEINTAALLQDHPLLPRSTMNQLCERFVEITHRDIREWLEKTLVQEKDDWYKDVRPEGEGGYLYTQLPNILFGMIDDTVQVTKEISQDIIPGVVDACVDEFLAFANKYRDAAQAYRNKHFENRSNFTAFTHTMIAVANNLHVCIDQTDKLKKHIRLTMETDPGHVSSPIDTQPPSSPVATTSARSMSSIFGVQREELISKIDDLKKRWNVGLQSAVNALLEEVYSDVAGHLSSLMSKSWLDSRESIGTIVLTVKDYYEDHQHLRPQVRSLLLMDMQYKVVGEYLIAIDARRLIYQNYDERAKAANRLKQDAQEIDQLMQDLQKRADTELDKLTQVLEDIAEIIDLTDKSLLQLEVASFVRKYPDIHVDLLASLVQSREDIGRQEARLLAEEVLGHMKFHPRGDRSMVRLFQMCKQDGKRAIPLLEETMQNMFATLAMTTRAATAVE